jgi:hypothetical protein
MGYSISWIAVRGKRKAEVLEHLQLRDSGKADEGNETPASGAELPTGWYVLFLNNLTHPFVQPPALVALSRGSTVVGCQVEEHVMLSVSFYYADGQHKWTITHDSRRGLNSLEVDGEAPLSLAKLYSDAQAEQENDTRVDYIFDVPLKAAEQVCGYRHDLWKFDWGEPYFRELVQRAEQLASGN